MSAAPTFSSVEEAAARIAGRVHRTPVLTSATLDRELNARVFFKCENFQKTGAFKARGACNAVFSLDEAQAVRGVITHSSGNHAAALAWASRLRGISCTVVMPRTASSFKRRAAAGYGARIVTCEEGEREAACARIQKETGAVFVHPNADPRVIAGQGTAAMELLEDCDGLLDLILAPVGGGGLLAGTALSARALAPRARVVGAEPEAVDDAARSLATGVRQPAVPHARTWADGLLTALGELDFAILRDLGAEVVTVSEDDIVAAARYFLERMKIVVEPSAATVLAALRRLGPALEGRRIGAILSGGNTDFAWLRA